MSVFLVLNLWEILLGFGCQPGLIAEIGWAVGNQMRANAKQ